MQHPDMQRYNAWCQVGELMREGQKIFYVMLYPDDENGETKEFASDEAAIQWLISNHYA
jgi:hypothetical protein